MLVNNVSAITSSENTQGRKTEYSPEASEPSIFTRVEGVVHPSWVTWFSKKFGLSHQMALNVGTALYSHLLRERYREIDLEAPSPEPQLPGEELVSMAFVVDYRHRHKVSYPEAYAAGYHLVHKNEGFPLVGIHRNSFN